MPVVLLFILGLLPQLLPVAPLHRFELRGKAQGTTWSVIYYATDSVVQKRHCDSVLVSLDSALSIYKPYSEINALNKAQRSHPLGPHLEAVLRRGLQVARQTGGAFDPAILPLVQAWGFGATRHAHPPDMAQVRALLRCTGYRMLYLRRGKAVKKKPCVQVDVNGIAQGYSVDVLAAYLAQRGITNYLVEIGGELRVGGRKQPSGEAFTVGIESPEAAASYGAPLQQTLRLDSGALTTSGSYRRYYLSGDKAISHLLHPRTGMTLQNSLIAVTVWAPDAITADAIDNALMVMGLQPALRYLARQKNLEAYFIYKKTNGTVADTATPGFARLFAPTTKPTTARVMED